ncbi:hypothetical protein Tco_0532168 [Tanacetum coccineum]
MYFKLKLTLSKILPSPSTYQRKQRKTKKHRIAKKVNELPQTSVPLDHGADEAVHKEGVTTRFERVLEKPNESPLLEGHTSGSGEGSMEHTFELMDTVPPTPHDSPLTGGYTPGSDESKLKLKELMAIYIKSSKQEINLEKEKYAQAMKILKINHRVKKLERKRKSSISHPRRRIYRQVESFDDDLYEEDASKAYAVDLFGLQKPDSPKAAPASPDYVLGLEEPEQAPLSPDYPYGAADLPVALSPGYIVDFDSEEDPEEDSKDGPVDYPADGGDDDDDDDSFDFAITRKQLLK